MFIYGYGNKLFKKETNGKILNVYNMPRNLFRNTYAHSLGRLEEKKIRRNTNKFM